MSKEPKSKEFVSSDSESGSEDDRVGPRSSVSAMKTSKRSRSASVLAMRTSKKSRSEGIAQGGSADERREPRFSALVTETSKKSISRDTACSSEDDKMGPRTPIPFEGESVEEGEFSLVF